jgi:plasmid stabilization system protein ParE
LLNFSFHPEAENELMQIVRYYNDLKRELGTEFGKEIYLTIQTILAFPYAGDSLSANSRRCLVNRFPYGIIYQIGKDEIIILAIMNLSRAPDYWLHRG